MEYVQVFINSLSDRYQNTCQLVMHHKMLLHLLLLLLLFLLFWLFFLIQLLLMLASSPATAYLTWISASAWRLTSAKIMREMWSNSSSNRAAAGTEPGFKSMASALLLLLPTSTVVATDRIIINQRSGRRERIKLYIQLALLGLPCQALVTAEWTGVERSGEGAIWFKLK